MYFELKVLMLNVLPHKGMEKKGVAAVNREEQVQQWFSSLCMLISVCA